MPQNDKSLESWIWDAACSIRGAKDAPKYKDYILPLIIDRVDFNATTHACAIWLTIGSAT
jgi:hypothetical protein